MNYSDYNVLIVDDEMDILKALSRDLRKEPYEKILANSGQEALKVFENKEISVIVTDMRMPNMNGLELLDQINQISPETVKIVLSGYTQLPQILATVNKVDIYKFLTKPWDVERELKQYILEGIELYAERKGIDQTIKSQEEKSKMFNKMLVDSYEKADYLTHLYGELVQAVNFHHIMTMQEMRTVSPNDNYEEQLRVCFSQMKERMYFINKIFDASGYGKKVFSMRQMAEVLSLGLKKVKREEVDLIVENDGLNYKDHYKMVMAVFGDFLESFTLIETEIKWVKLDSTWSENYSKLKLKIVSTETDELKVMLKSRGKFIQQIIKTLGGEVTFEVKDDVFESALCFPVKIYRS